MVNLCPQPRVPHAEALRGYSGTAAQVEPAAVPASADDGVKLSASCVKVRTYPKSSELTVVKYR